MKENIKLVARRKKNERENPPNFVRQERKIAAW